MLLKRIFARLMEEAPAGGFANLTDLKTYIDAAMNALATGAGDPAAGTYAVQTVDLSSFTSYA